MTKQLIPAFLSYTVHVAWISNSQQLLHIQQQQNKNIKINNSNGDDDDDYMMMMKVMMIEMKMRKACRVFHSFTFHLRFVHPLEDVALHQCLPLSSVCCSPVAIGFLLVMLSCHLLIGCPLDLFPVLGCHSVQHLVHLLSFILSICPAHLHICFSVYSVCQLSLFLS